MEPAKLNNRTVNSVVKQHLVFGAGLIGGFMAGSFASKGLSVTVVGRESMRERFNSDLTLTDYLDHRATVSGIKFVASGEQSKQQYDFIWLTVKCTSLAQALLDLTPFVSTNTVILSCQNGLGSDVQVKAAFPNNEVRRVIMISNVAQPNNSHLHRGSQGGLLIGAYSMGDGSTLADLVSTDLLVAQNIKDMEAYSWAKLQLNLGNAVNALAGVPVKKMLESRSLRKIIALSMRELLTIANAKQLVLPKLAAVPMRMVPTVLNTPDFLFSMLGSKMMDIDPTVRTSMWWDLHNQRLSEVDNLNGAVVSEGKKLAIDCPVNQKIVESIHSAESNFGEPLEPFCADEFLSDLS